MQWSRSSLPLRIAKPKKLKALELLSFVDSPPVRVAFLQFMDWYELLGFKLSDRDFHKALVKARPAFHDLMFGDKTTARIENIHSYIIPEANVLTKWTPHQLILRFLIWCEIWRQQKTPRSEIWNIGSSEIVAHFLTAMLLNYKMMWREDCLYKSKTETNLIWDRVWEDWLRKYSLQELDEVVNGEYFHLRDQFEMSEAEVLEEVGYLGGIGQCDDTYRPARYFLGYAEDRLMHL
ncbi:hypothetical protein IL306_015109 [Fusarium sp. DS 682]|nr:hypothetical protein IL306_015109 [Fusarium sp. DS 682]